ncbi:MAG: class I SAM-dependent methyltransferase [Candidatus Paceibacterota bacterium]
MYRQDFDIGIEYYQGKGINLGEGKLIARLRNIKDRLYTLKKYISLNDLCDVGTGEGLFLDALQKGGWLNVVGIEPDKKASEFAQSKGFKVIRGTLDDLGVIVEKKHIKTVTLFHVIEHLQDPKAAMAYIYSVLPEGGYLVIETPNIDGYGFRKSEYEHPLVYPEHLYYFNESNLNLLLKKVGFKIVAHGKRGFDQYNMSIWESLFRLGFLKSPFQTQDEKNSLNVKKGEERDASRGIVREVARKALSVLVVWLGRVDYQWVIVQKK